MLARYCRSAADVAELVRRVRSCFALQLAEGNRARLMGFYRAVIEHLRGVSQDTTMCGGAHQLLSGLARHMFELTAQSPLEAGIHWRAVLSRMQKRVSTLVLDGARASAGAASGVGAGAGAGEEGDADGSGGTESAWPRFGELAVLQLLAKLFPVTDFRHTVVTPALLLMGQCVSQCPLATPSDVASAVVVCGLLVAYTEQASRVVPEVFSFTHGILCACLKVPKGGRDKTTLLQPSLPALSADRAGVAKLKWLRRGLWLYIRSDGDVAEPKPTSITADTTLPLLAAAVAQTREGVMSVSPTLCAQLVAAVVRLLQRAARACRGNAALPQLLEPSLANLGFLDGELRELEADDDGSDDGSDGRGDGGGGESLRGTALSALVHRANAEVQALSDARERGRPAMRLQAEVRKPVAIKAMDPEIEEHFSMAKDKSADKEANEAKKLTRAIKREQRGARRELRRDSEFITRVRDEEAAARDSEREAKTREVMAFLQNQQATFKQQVKLGFAKGGGSSNVFGERKKRRRGPQ